MPVNVNHFACIREDFGNQLVCDHPSHELRPNPYCPAIEQFISDGRDAIWIKPGSFTTFNAIREDSSTATTVEIGSELGPGFADMRVHHKRKVGGYTFFDLGIWNKGEGRHSIRTVLWDSMSSLVDPRDMEQSNKIHTKCPNPAHTSTQQFALLSKVYPNSTYKSVCLFHIIFEKMCTECLALVSNDLDGLTGVPLDA